MKKIETGYYQGTINEIDFTVYKTNKTIYTTYASKKDYIYSSKESDWTLNITINEKQKIINGLGTKKEAQKMAERIVKRGY